MKLSCTGLTHKGIKKAISILLLVTGCLILTVAKSQDAEDPEFKPSGSPFAKIYSNFHIGLTKQNNISAFELTRAYLGYKYNISKNLSAKANIDIGNPKNASCLEHTAYIKIAALTYHKERLTCNFGLIELTQFKLQEKVWGHRYVYKSFQDEHKFGSSADLGASMSYKLNRALSVDFTVINGEGYKKLQSDNVYKSGAGITLSPVKGMTIRAYYDYLEKSSAQTTISTFIGYHHKKIFTLGGEYTAQSNNNCIDNHHLTGISIYGMYNITQKIEIFGRFDKLSSNTISDIIAPWNLSKNGSIIIGGIQYKPVKCVKIAANYQGWIPDDAGQHIQPFIYLNLEYGF